MNVLKSVSKPEQQIMPCNEWPVILDENELTVKTNYLAGWELLRNEKDEKGNVYYKLSKKVEASDFLSALDYLNKIGVIAEKRNHHPDLHLTGFKNIQIIIFTHSLSGLTQNDFNLAKAFDEVPLVKDNF